MRESSKRVYIDSDVYLNVILGRKDTNPERYETSLAVIEKGQDGDYQIVASALLRAEVGCSGRL
ncbi:hypothetical protein HNR23_004053 [Nocardiopsis mwathae]|uniref:PIN domain-containing protein n=1 Tax=Nocardiopsis mwathae TaxID=1472723 RepID=A0A7W9YKT1_9ACTN|nr:hypothetical protein [Nocardiopsis mwathae]MBB6173993.1 hypothetical protein [Nocardiopsis mwathae]